MSVILRLAITLLLVSVVRVDVGREWQYYDTVRISTNRSCSAHICGRKLVSCIESIVYHLVKIKYNVISTTF